MEQNSEIIIYTTIDGTTKLQVQLEDETVWLTQDQMAMLFGKAKSTINEHIKNIYAEEELEENQTLKKFGISEFQQKTPNYYGGWGRLGCLLEYWFANNSMGTGKGVKSTYFSR